MSWNPDSNSVTLMEVFILCASVSSPINRTIHNIQRHWKEQRQCAWSIVSTRQRLAIIMAPAHSRSSTMNVQLFQKELRAFPLGPCPGPHPHMLIQPYSTVNPPSTTLAEALSRHSLACMSPLPQQPSRSRSTCCSISSNVQLVCWAR